MSDGPQIPPEWSGRWNWQILVVAGLLLVLVGGTIVCAVPHW